MENKILKELIEIEKDFDIYNGENGDKEAYCKFCNSTKYNGKVGIVHDENCPLLRLRSVITNISK